VCCSEIRLEDIPDMGYLHTDPHPRGELCVRAGNVFAGYYKDEENTKATIIDGWLHTGDVARINPNGTLSIIDRKKNMFKLSQGEYIAAEKIEQVYAKSPAVGQIWVYGNSFKSFLLAVVVPAAEPLAQYAHSKGWWPQSDKETARLASDSFLDDFATLMNGPHAAELKAWVVASLREQEKGLKGFERVKDFLIEPRIDRMGSGFTEANDCLTPTFKLKRPQLLKAYIKELKGMYEQHGEGDNPGEKWPGEP
jgi:long-chain acyl-CoA synthetase